MRSIGCACILMGLLSCSEDRNCALTATCVIDRDASSTRDGAVSESDDPGASSSGSFGSSGQDVPNDADASATQEPGKTGGPLGRLPAASTGGTLLGDASAPGDAGGRPDASLSDSGAQGAGGAANSPVGPATSAASDDTPTDDTPTDDTPTDDTPTDDLASDDTPTDDTATDELATGDTDEPSIDDSVTDDSATDDSVQPSLCVLGQSVVGDGCILGG